MGWVPVLIASSAAWLFWKQESLVLSASASVVAFIALLTYAVMYAGARRAAVERRNRVAAEARAQGAEERVVQVVEKLPVLLSEGDKQQAPDWATLLNMLGTLAAVVLLVWAFLAR